MSLYRKFLAALIFLSCVPVWADVDIGCPLQPALNPAERAARAAASRDAPTHLRANSVRADQDGATELDGSVELIRGADRITADRLRYDKPTDTADASGDVQLGDAAGDRYYSRQLRLQLGSHIGEAGPSRYFLDHDRARGDAVRIDFQGPDRRQLTETRYTTCRQGQDDWFLKIGRLELDSAEDLGTAYDTTVDFLGVPIFYFPYVNFPISERRKSGFLFPRLGYSDKYGVELAAPYYFNLAPNYDATVTPRVLTDRGVQLQNEFRYLDRNGRGELQLDVLPHDRVTGTDRFAGAFRDQHVPAPLWSSNIDIERASDKGYFTDFGDRLALTSQAHLPQTADLIYRGSSWMFASRLADHQTLDKTIAPEGEPYARLPQLQLVNTTLPTPNQWTPQFESEWNRFDHKVLLTGERVNLNTGLSLPLQNEWGFLTPKVGARYIGYRLDRSTDDAPGLARGVLSLDSGIVLERETQWGERSMVQTFEPRLFYLRVPSKNQDALPVFDSALPDLSFAALFRENRFIGGDRIGDANQITVGLSTRFYDTADGMERLRLSLGRSYYLNNKLEISLPAGVQNRPASDIVAEASAWLPGNWHARETLQWSAENERMERTSFYLQYQPRRNKIVNVGQVFVRDQTNQYDISTEWPIGGRWGVRARAMYSVQDHRNVESYAGIEYNACCWAIRVLAARRFQDPDQVNSIMLELQLNGLSRLGGVPDSPLRQGLFTFKDARTDESLHE